MRHGLSTHPAPNRRFREIPPQHADWPDRWQFERHAAGVEPSELRTLYRQRTRRERLEFCVWWGLIGMALGCVWYVVFDVGRMLFR